MGNLNHLACIMDGNGRWAEQRGLKRTDGHKEGAYAAERVAKGCIKNGIRFLTLYCFSTENWKRPKDEVNYLMGLLSMQVQANIPKFNKLDIRILFLGNKENLLTSMNNFEREFDKIKKCIEENDEKGLQELFIKSTIRREKL